MRDRETEELDSKNKRFLILDLTETQLEHREREEPVEREDLVETPLGVPDLHLGPRVEVECTP